MLHVPLVEAFPDDDWEEGYGTWESESESDKESTDSAHGDNSGDSAPQVVSDSATNPSNDGYSSSDKDAMCCWETTSGISSSDTQDDTDDDKELVYT
jgi:hypothetical protein